MKNRQKWAVSLIWMLIYHRALCPMQAKRSENSTGLCTQWTQLGTRRNDLRGGSAMNTNDWAAGKTAQRIESQNMVCNFLGPIKRSKMCSMSNSRRLPGVISAVKSGRKSAALGGGGKKDTRMHLELNRRYSKSAWLQMITNVRGPELRPWKVCRQLMTRRFKGSKIREIIWLAEISELVIYLILTKNIFEKDAKQTAMESKSLVTL